MDCGRHFKSPAFSPDSFGLLSLNKIGLLMSFLFVLFVGFILFETMSNSCLKLVLCVDGYRIF